MTEEEIIELAKRAGFERLGHDDCDYVCYPDEIKKFAQLIARECAQVCRNPVSYTHLTLPTILRV